MFFLITEKTQTEDQKLFFKTGESLPAVTVGSAHDNVVLECQAGGKPASTIHWLKNGQRIQQVSYWFHVEMNLLINITSLALENDRKLICYTICYHIK